MTSSEPSGKQADEVLTRLSINGAHVRTIAVAVVLCMGLVAIAGVGAVLLGGDKAGSSIVAIVSSSVSAAGAVAAALFSVRAASESNAQGVESAIAAVERQATRSAREEIAQELSECSAEQLPSRSLVLRGRRLGISYAEQAELVNVEEQVIRQIGDLKRG